MSASPIDPQDSRPLNTTTTTLPAPSAFVTLSIHEDVAVVLASLKTPQGPGNGNPDKLLQGVLNDEGGDSPLTNKTIVHWSFVSQNKEYNMLLRLQVENMQNDEEIRIEVESVDEEDLDSTCSQAPAPIVARPSRLLVK
ncbi:hypothetical protein TrVE_jg12237, partial [Triparma verrucosa]